MTETQKTATASNNEHRDFLAAVAGFYAFRNRALSASIFMEESCQVTRMSDEVTRPLAEATWMV